MNKKANSASKRQYRKYDENVLKEVVDSIRKKKISINKAAKKYNISKGTLINRLHNKHAKPVGSPLVLSKLEEDTLVEHIITVAEWGFPFDKKDLRHLTKLYLDKCNRNVKQFNDNLPTRQWASRFMKRHKQKISDKKCQNLKRNKADLDPDLMQKYFDNLKETLTEEDGSFVPPNRIFNYDETNLSDDPGVKRFIFKRGVKYPERVMDSSKASISLMFCGSAAGDVLPPYVVYKSMHLYPEWMRGGPPGTRYNRSKNGWFDAIIFRDWFEELFLPYILEHKLNKDGKVVLIGDNLSSHFCSEVLKLCEENNIVFVCIPKNSTHKTQPLDVAFYGPMKTYWRDILGKWKARRQKLSQTVTKEKFPGLLNDLFNKITGSKAHSSQLVAGFKKTGIYPFDSNSVISQLPGQSDADTDTDTVRLVSESVLDILKDLRYGDPSEKKQRRTKLNVEPGRSIGFEDLPKLLAPVNRLKSENIQSKLRKMTKGKRSTTGKKTKKVNKMAGRTNKNKGGKVIKVIKAKNRKNTKNELVSDDDLSESDLIMNNKKGIRGMKKKRIFSDSEESGVELASKNMNGKNRRVGDNTKEVQGKNSKSKNKKIGGKKIKNKIVNKKPKIQDSDTEQSFEEINDNIFQQLVRPSISEVKVGDYVVIEYVVKQSKKHYIGMITSIRRDVLRVCFLMKSGSKFIFPVVADETYILPTQIVKILSMPNKSDDGKFVFSINEIRGIAFN